MELQRTKVIYNGVDYELLGLGIDSSVGVGSRLAVNRPIILNVGSEEPRKNIPTLLEAFKASQRCFRMFS